MATLKSTTVEGVVTQSDPASAAEHLVRKQEHDEAMEAFRSSYAHDEASYGFSPSIELQITGQQITPVARLASDEGLIAGERGAVGVHTGPTGYGFYVVLGQTAYSAAPGNHTHGEASGSNAGFLSAALFSKLTDIEAEATKNAADSHLLDRDNHTGTQAWSTISDFIGGVQAYALPLGGGEITGLVTFSTEGMLRLVNLTEAERDALTPGVGWKIFNTTSGKEETYNGSAWVAMPADTSGGADFSNVYGHFTISGQGHGLLNAGAVELSHLADTVTERFMIRKTAGAGSWEAGTASDVRGMLNVANGATANSADSHLLDRANHTGTASAASISDFDAAVALTALSKTENNQLSGNLTFTGSDNPGVQLSRLTTAEADAIGLGASDKGFLIYNATTNRVEVQTPSGRVALLASGEGGDFLLTDGSAASTGRRQEFAAVNLKDPSLKTIDSDGHITIDQGFHRFRPDAGAGHYALYSMYGGQVGDSLEFFLEAGAEPFTIVHDDGNIRCAGGADLTVDANSKVNAHYDHAGLWRVGMFGSPGTGGGGGGDLPVNDTTLLVKDPVTATNRVGLKADAVTGDAFIQSPDGDSRVRDTLEHLVFAGDEPIITLQDYWLRSMPAAFYVERVMGFVYDTSEADGEVQFDFKVNGTVRASVTVNVTGGKADTEWGEDTTLLVNHALAKGDVLEVYVTDDGGGGSGPGADGLIVTVVGYWLHE